MKMRFNESKAVFLQVFDQFESEDLKINHINHTSKIFNTVSVFPNNGDYDKRVFFYLFLKALNFFCV